MADISKITIGSTTYNIKDNSALHSHQDISGKENTSNKVTSWSSTTTDAHYPSEKLVKSALDGKASTSTATTSANGLMSSTDKSKLDGITEGAKKFIFDTKTSTAFTDDPDNTLNDYPFRAYVTDSNVTANDKVDVQFSVAQINSGIYGPITNSFSSGFYIYSTEAASAQSISYTIFKA